MNVTDAPNGRRKDSNYKKSPEYKLRKKREKEQRKKIAMIKRAEKYRMMRQMQQLDTQLNAIPTSDSHTTVTALKKALKTIIKNYNPRKIKHILTPNKNDIVDVVTSDKSHIAKLQNQVKDLQKVMEELFELVKASQTFNVASTLAMASGAEPDVEAFALDGGGGGGGAGAGDSNNDNLGSPHSLWQGFVLNRQRKDQQDYHWKIEIVQWHSYLLRLNNYKLH